MEPKITRINPDQLHRPPGYHHVTVVHSDRMAYLAGQCPLDRQGDLVGPGDLVAQIDQVIANVVQALSAVGARPDDVVRSVIYVTSNDVVELGAAWYRLTGSVDRARLHVCQHPARRCATRLPGQLVEVELTAALRGD